MRRSLVCLLLLLTSCQGIIQLPSKTNTPPAPAPETSTPLPGLGAFEFRYDEKCPHLCWLGINPDLTTAQQAIVLIRTSNRIDQSTVEISDTRIFGRWFSGEQGTHPNNFSVFLNGGLVKSITIGTTLDKLVDFLKVLGEPDEISLSVVTLETEYMYYAIYYSKQKIVLDVGAQGMSGPTPEDRITGVYLNYVLSKDLFPGYWQPWLGYGHVGDYFKGTKIPPTFEPSSP